MLHDPLVILDFGATGLRPRRGDRITEVGLVRIEDGHICARYQSLVNCGARVPASIAACTGITQQMIDAAPPVAEVMREVAAFIDGTTVVAHCASFDQSLYRHECWRLGLGKDEAITPFICSMRLARRIYPELPGHSLGILSQALGLGYRGTLHRAAADAEATALLMLRLVRDIARMHEGITVTTKVLRHIVAKPPERQPGQERLCA